MLFVGSAAPGNPWLSWLGRLPLGWSSLSSCLLLILSLVISKVARLNAIHTQHLSSQGVERRNGEWAISDC